MSGAKLSVCVCTSEGDQLTLVAEASPLEAIEAMRAACCVPRYQNVWARRQRMDGSIHIVFLAELEEMFAFAE